jgi:hypothetical protein
MAPASHGVRRRLAAALLITVPWCEACQVWRTERVAPKSLLATHRPATLRVTRTDGTEIVLKDPVLQGDTLSGRPRQTGGEDVRIPLTGVRRLATRRFSPGRTIGLGMGVAALAYVAFLIGVVACGCD